MTLDVAHGILSRMISPKGEKHQQRSAVDLSVLCFTSWPDASVERCDGSRKFRRVARGPEAVQLPVTL